VVAAGVGAWVLAPAMRNQAGLHHDGLGRNRVGWVPGLRPERRAL